MFHPVGVSYKRDVETDSSVVACQLLQKWEWRGERGKYLLNPDMGCTCMYYMYKNNCRNNVTAHFHLRLSELLTFGASMAVYVVPGGTWNPSVYSLKWWISASMELFE